MFHLHTHIRCPPPCKEIRSDRRSRPAVRSLSCTTWNNIFMMWIIWYDVIYIYLPVADEVLLVKHRSCSHKWKSTFPRCKILFTVWTQESSAPAVWFTHIEDLAVRGGVRVDPGKVLLGAAEARVWHRAEHGVVRPGHSGDRIHHHFTVRTWRWCLTLGSLQLRDGTIYQSCSPE